jgi:hypothetical protein
MRGTDTLHEDQYTYVINPRSVLLKMRNVSDKDCREKQNKFYVQYYFVVANSFVYEIMWKNKAQADRTQLTI